MFSYSFVCQPTETNTEDWIYLSIAVAYATLYILSLYLQLYFKYVRTGYN